MTDTKVIPTGTGSQGDTNPARFLQVPAHYPAVRERRTAPGIPSSRSRSAARCADLQRRLGTAPSEVVQIKTVTADVAAAA